MDRGLKVVIAGLVPMICLFALASVIHISDATARVIVPLGFLVTAALFMTGTAMIVTGKGHPVALGICLGFIAPLGTMIALIMQDTKRSNRTEPPEDITRGSASDSPKATTIGDFSRLRDLITGIAAVVAVIYALIHFGVVAADMLRFKGGIPAAKVLIAAVQGLMSGLAVWGLVVMWTVTIAPQQWLLRSKSGKQWMARTGLQTKTNTLPLRVMTAIIGAVATAWAMLSIIIMIEILTPKK